eukprot:scaffold23289_cov74-Cyclotella_meneghiniana.AAC.2
MMHLPNKSHGTMSQIMDTCEGETNKTPHHGGTHKMQQSTGGRCERVISQDMYVIQSKAHIKIRSRYRRAARSNYRRAS